MVRFKSTQEIRIFSTAEEPSWPREWCFDLLNVRGRKRPLARRSKALGRIRHLHGNRARVAELRRRLPALRLIPDADVNFLGLPCFGPDWTLLFTLNANELRLFLRRYRSRYSKIAAASNSSFTQIQDCHSLKALLIQNLRFCGVPKFLSSLRK